MATPVRAKVKAQAAGGTAAGSISVLAIYALGEVGWNPPPEIGAAVGTLVTAGIGFVAGYMKKEDGA